MQTSPFDQPFSPLCLISLVKLNKGQVIIIQIEYYNCTTMSINLNKVFILFNPPFSTISALVRCPLLTFCTKYIFVKLVHQQQLSVFKTKNHMHKLSPSQACFLSVQFPRLGWLSTVREGNCGRGFLMFLGDVIWEAPYATWRQIKMLNYYITYQLINVIIFPDIILILMQMQRNKKKQEWSPEEVKLLQSLHPEFTSKKWKRISEVFKSKGFNRSEIDCRQKWINFVDPSINKKEWQEWELRRMYEIHSEMGTRWCFVQKEIGRTQNKIKNRFYGTLRNFIRFLLNYFDNGRSSLNYQITKLSPKFLNEMYNSQHDFLYLNGEVKHAIFQMGFKVDKRIMTQKVRQNRSLYTRLHQLIVTTFQELNQPVQSQPVPSQSVSIMKHKHDQPSESENMAASGPEGERSVKHEEQELKQLDLPRTSQNLQNVYLNVSYQSMAMMQYQQNSQVYYYVLSYL